MPIYVTRPYTPPLKEYVEELRNIWASQNFTNEGQYVSILKQEISKYLGLDNYKEGLQIVTNGTIAIQLAIEALDIHDGEIITTPFTYVATVNSILWQRCKPVFVDIEPYNFTINADLIEEAITCNTKAILPVHVFGYACQVEKIQKIADLHNLPVIYDAAHAFGSKYKGKSLLKYGDISTVSFHATKLFHSAEGGCIISNSKSLDERIELIKKFGHVYDLYECVGINAKMSELHAALGLVNFRHLSEIYKERARVSEIYDSLLLNRVQRPKEQKDLDYNYAYYPVVFENEKTLVEVTTKLNSLDIFPRRYFYPSLNKIPYIKAKPCPVSESIANRVLCLPLYVGLSADEIEIISDCVLKVVS